MIFFALKNLVNLFCNLYLRVQSTGMLFLLLPFVLLHLPYRTVFILVHNLIFMHVFSSFDISYKYLDISFLLITDVAENLFHRGGSTLKMVAAWLIFIYLCLIG
jgi:hypothetical protein